MSKVKPILYMFGKGGISVLQTSIFLNRDISNLIIEIFLFLNKSFSILT